MIKDVTKATDQITTEDPERVAYDYLGETNAYGDLKAHSDAYVAKINGLDFPEKASVVIWGGQTFGMIASFLDTIKAGHAYIPTASYSNSGRLLMIQEVSESPSVITIDKLPTEMDDTKVLTLKEVSDNHTEIEQSKLVDRDDNFYTILTLDITGKPKGMQINHDNLLSFVNWKLSNFLPPDQPSFLAQAPYSFDLSVISLHPALIVSGKLIVLPHNIIENLGQLFKTLPQLKSDVWVSTPSFVEVSFLDPTFDAEHHPGLIHFLFCGEKLSHKTTKTLRMKFPDSHIFNTYGLTETTVIATQIEITDDILNKYDRLPVGVSKKDIKVSVDTSEGEEKDQDEVIIEGLSVSEGYLNNPEEAKAVFFKDGEHSSYYTGGLGFLDGDMLLYRGRMDFQVKFNSYHTELEEISLCLAKNPLARYGVVVPRCNKDCKVQRLVAVAELADGVRGRYDDAKLTKELRESLNQNIMPYMLPQRFIYCDEVPISQNGKVGTKQVTREVNNA